jgi:acyl dehydratase
VTTPGGQATGADRIHASFDPAALEEWTATSSFLVDPDLCRRYAAATNDTHPGHLSGALAPPLVGVFATVPHVQEVLRRNLPEEVMTRNLSVHGEQDIRYHAPVAVGASLLVRARLHGVHPRSTGTVFVTRVELADPAGRVIQEQDFVNFLRGVVTGEPIGAEPADHRLPGGLELDEPAATERSPIDADQTFRYAEASGDRSVYHLNDAAARTAGFPGIIVHGLCAMAFAGRAVVEHACSRDPSRLRRLAVRFSRPLYPSQTLTTTLWAPGDGDRGPGGGAWRFQARSDSGDTVITDGLALVGPLQGEERSA